MLETDAEITGDTVTEIEIVRIGVFVFDNDGKLDEETVPLLLADFEDVTDGVLSEDIVEDIVEDDENEDVGVFDAANQRGL